MAIMKAWHHRAIEDCKGIKVRLTKIHASCKGTHIHTICSTNDPSPELPQRVPTNPIQGLEKPVSESYSAALVLNRASLGTQSGLA